MHPNKCCCLFLSQQWKTYFFFVGKIWFFSSTIQAVVIVLQSAQCLCCWLMPSRLSPVRTLYAAQRARLAENVHKPPLRMNVNNFELNGFNASIWVSWSPSDPKRSWCTDRNIQIHKTCVKIAPILAFQWNIDLPDFSDAG